MRNRFYEHSRKVMGWGGNGNVSMVIGSSDDTASMKCRRMGMMNIRCGEHDMNIVMRREMGQVRGVVDDEF